MYRQLNFRAGRFGLFTWFVTDFDRIKTSFIKLKFRRATKCSAADRKCGWLGGAPHFVRRRRRESVSAGGGGEIRRLRGLCLTFNCTFPKLYVLAKLPTVSMLYIVIVEIFEILYIKI